MCVCYRELQMSGKKSKVVQKKATPKKVTPKKTVTKKVTPKKVDETEPKMKAKKLQEIDDNDSEDETGSTISDESTEDEVEEIASVHSDVETDDESEKTDTESEEDEESDKESESDAMSDAGSDVSLSFKSDKDDEDACIVPEIVDDVKTPAVRVKDEDRITGNMMTSYEFVRVIGVRAQQIALGAKLMIRVDDTNLSSLQLATLELEHKKTPLKIIRPLPNNKYEVWKIAELELPNTKDIL